MTTATEFVCPTGCAHDGCHGFCTTHGEPTRHYDGRSCDCDPTVPARPLPEYVYVASSWRNPFQPVVVALLAAAGIRAYDFRNPEGATGFGWHEVMPSYDRDDQAGTPGGSGLVMPADYLAAIEHPRAVEGFDSDFAAMEKADTFVLVLPCGRSAHLELGWAVGAGKRTAILLEGPNKPMVPELMYRMVDHIATSPTDLLAWCGVG